MNGQRMPGAPFPSQPYGVPPSSPGMPMPPMGGGMAGMMPHPGGAALTQPSPNAPAGVSPTGQPFSRMPGVGQTPQQQAGRQRLIANTLVNPGQ